MYLKLNNGVIEKYPYTIGDLRKDNPQVSFPTNIPSETLQEYGVFSVVSTGAVYNHETQEATQEGCIYNDTKQRWETAWVVRDIPSEEIYQKKLQECIQNRANEYPPMADYLDGVVKGDQAQIDKYIADCLAVKTKYPKPN
jgi:hypothetical protein